MKAAVYHQFGGNIGIEIVPDPKPVEGGVVLKVESTGLLPFRLARLDGPRF